MREEGGRGTGDHSRVRSRGLSGFLEDGSALGYLEKDKGPVRGTVEPGLVCSPQHPPDPSKETRLSEDAALGRGSGSDLATPRWRLRRLRHFSVAQHSCL